VRALEPESASGLIGTLLETRVAIFRRADTLCTALSVVVRPVVVG